MLWGLEHPILGGTQFNNVPHEHPYTEASSYTTEYDKSLLSCLASSLIQYNNVCEILISIHELPLARHTLYYSSLPQPS